VRKLSIVALLMLACLPATAQAADKKARDFVPVQAGSSGSVKLDRAYILFRTKRSLARAAIAPVLMRVPTGEEMTRYDVARAQAFAQAAPKLREARAKILARKASTEAAGKPFEDAVPPEPMLDNFEFTWDEAVNIENADLGKPYLKGAAEQAYLIELRPGDYVVYGASFGGILRPGLHVCFCLGTVGFTAKAGEITDLGYWLSDVVKMRSNIPELAAESNFGPSSDPFLVLIGGTVVPATSGLAVPAGIPAAAVKTAQYGAIGRYFNPGTMGLNRLVAVPGVLGYDRGKVIDLRTGQTVPDVD
jgi:hypothetical protein